MITRSAQDSGFLPLALIIGLSAVSKADAHGGHGGHPGGHGATQPAGTALLRGSRAYKAPRMSHSAPLHGQTPRASTHEYRGGARRNNSAQTRATHTQGPASQSPTNLARTDGDCSKSPTPWLLNTAGSHRPTAFHRIRTPMDTGNGARPIGPMAMVTATATVVTERGYGYGRSQGNNRAVVVAAEIGAREPCADRS